MASQADKDHWVRRVLELDAVALRDPQATANAPKAQWERLFPDIEAAYLRVLRTNPPDAGKLRAVMDFANGQAMAGQHVKGVVALNRLSTMLDAATQAAGTAGQPQTDVEQDENGHAGLVTYRKTLLAFRQAASVVDGRIISLKAAIPARLPDETQLANALAEFLGEYNEALLDAVDEAMNVADNPGSPVTQMVVDQLRDYAAEVVVNPLIRHVDKNPFGVSMNVGKTLGDALAAIRAAMPQAA